MDLDVHLGGIVAGEPDAFARWLAGAERPVRASLRDFAASVDTEAVLQESLLRVWQVAPRFKSDGAPNSLLRFALRSARNLAVSETRRHRPQLLPDEALLRAAESFAVDVAAAPDPLLRERIAECREKLPKKPALALAARLGGAGRSDAELAESLAMKLNTFLQNFTRARSLLARCLERAGVALDEVL